MKFQFRVDLTREDHLNFNLFQALRSDWGRKRIKCSRIRLTLLYVPLGLIVPPLMRFHPASITAS